MNTKTWAGLKLTADQARFLSSFTFSRKMDARFRDIHIRIERELAEPLYQALHTKCLAAGLTKHATFVANGLERMMTYQGPVRLNAFVFFTLQHACRQVGMATPDWFPKVRETETAAGKKNRYFFDFSTVKASTLNATQLEFAVQVLKGGTCPDQTASDLIYNMKEMAPSTAPVWRQQELLLLAAQRLGLHGAALELQHQINTPT